MGCRAITRNSSVNYLPVHYNCFMQQQKLFTLRATRGSWFEPNKKPRVPREVLNPNHKMWQCRGYWMQNDYRSFLLVDQGEKWTITGSTKEGAACMGTNIFQRSQDFPPLMQIVLGTNLILHSKACQARPPRNSARNNTNHKSRGGHNHKTRVIHFQEDRRVTYKLRLISLEPGDSLLDPSSHQKLMRQSLASACSKRVERPSSSEILLLGKGMFKSSAISEMSTSAEEQKGYHQIFMILLLWR
ncbi:hypothetical protein CDAR_20711 [Caerostris darwini]|uniref:Uncharacterized protein n=1 Tax=Caerostris darwini TaxID=1538125 RepID=A0AAV4QGZ7_9ARAC|nr:hypothetical protein CDAR_20711 [Caerostris darwini]